MQAIDIIFTAKDKKELAEGLKEIIISEFRNQLQESQSYFFNGVEIEELVEGVIKECKEEVKDDIKKIFLKKYEEKMNEILD